MIRNQMISVGSMIILSIILLNIILVGSAYINNLFYWSLLFTIPILILALYDRFQRKHSVIRNYPIIGRLRYFFESIRPEIRQYFFESDTDGKPFSRRQRSVVYQRAKNERQTVAFGMQDDPTAPGYEWVAHSIYPVDVDVKDLRVWIGNQQCLQPYHSSIYNIAAMSYGALSKTAITSLNEGAMLGGFAHNTGEGGISDYHLKGGDLIWQIGTGYFGCRDNEGRFNPIAFRNNALRSQVKMIELKISQGAKPGHGGILPGTKNTEEIAAIRQVKPGVTVHSPSRHKEFNDAFGMIRFIQLLRELSDGKPVGFKLCIGNKQEFTDICEAMMTTGILPDFISIDGAEGGTGAAPLEFTDNLGMPLYEALAFVKATLDKYNISDEIKILAAGKIITGFDILKAISLGASACYSARGMMLALGCIQALQCDSGKCPVGVATQDPKLYKGIHPADKRVRIANFHRSTIHATKEIMEACAFRGINSVKPDKFFRRINEQDTKNFKQIYFERVNNMLHNNFEKQLN